MNKTESAVNIMLVIY